GTIVSYAWDFGDGSTGSGVNPTHIYSTAGTFAVSLTVTDNDGATDSASTTADIAAIPNVAPTADPNGPYNGTAGSPVNFNGSGSSDSDGTIVSYAWDFGDGNGGAGVSPSHTYAVAGLYTVTLTVTDNDGASDSASTTATIDPIPNVAPTSNPNGPYNGTAGSPVNFNGSGSSDSDGTIVSYAWDFGDGNGGAGISPSHTYAAAGLYTVTLIVTDNDGATDSASTTATIDPIPNVAPTSNPNGPYSGTVGTPVSFDGSGSTDSDGTIVSYAWDFGDGNGGAGISPSHTYAAAGLYTVTLIVTDNDGATDSASTTADIAAIPNVDLDIVQFRVTKHVRLAKVKPIGISVVVRNAGAVEDEAPATVVGIQNGIEVYNRTLTVSDSSGNGRTRFDFPSLRPGDAGDILWTVTLVDGDPDIDRAVATTTVVQ
ncbi:MAG: PKD domain-containing protein, partial [Gammaproteobacteria bacterium]|nr:PKD domain-containing protein [Gammaproteobacteria bacterium]